MKKYEFTQIPIYSGYINENQVAEHMNNHARAGWILLGTHVLQPMENPMNRNGVDYGPIPGSFNFFWEREDVETPKPVTKEDERVQYWKENLRRKI